MLHRKLLIADFESDSPKPEVCQPVQLAALMIDMYTLEVVEDSKFCSMMKPDIKDWGKIKPEIVDWESYTKDKDIVDTAKWHAKNYKVGVDEIFKMWEEAPEQRHVWDQFRSYVTKYNVKKSIWGAPVCGGMNIRDFDLTIVDRLNTKYGLDNIFWRRDVYDIQDFVGHWLPYRKDCPNNFKMDTLREYFGLTTDNAHDALKDVEDEAEIIIRFMKLHQSLCNKIAFTPKDKAKLKAKEEANV